MLSIRAVCEITGTNAHLLRAWERRYRAFKPRRTSTGRRLYSREDVEKIKLLSALTERGHKIQDIAPLTVDRLEQILKRAAEQSEGKQAPFLADNSVAYYLNAIAKQVALNDMRATAQLLRRAQMQFATRQFLFDLVAPLLADVGQKTESGELEIYQEHALSAVLRHQLSGLLYYVDSGLTSKTVFLLAAPAGDHHEFGVLMAAIVAALNGFTTYYFGPNLPAPSLALAAQKFKDIVVVVGMAAPKSELPNTELNAYLKSLAGGLTPSAKLWLGGSRLQDVKIPSGARAFGSLQEFDQALRGLQT